MKRSNKKKGERTKSEKEVLLGSSGGVEKRGWGGNLEKGQHWGKKKWDNSEK